MHPILARGRLLALYLGMWTLVGGLLAFLLVAQLRLEVSGALLTALPLASVYGFVCLSAWYVARGLPLATTSAPRVLATALVAAVVSALGWLYIAHVWMRTLQDVGWMGAPRGDEAGAGAIVGGLGVVLYLLALAVSYVLVAYEAARDSERRALQVQVQAREAELRSLRAQIDPHFLFNSLNSISALTASDPASARRMCVLLAEFLRESLALGSADRITLGQELTLVERFLAIEQIRFGDRLSVAVEADGVGDLPVPPLLLQPIVENAVTHGVAHVLEGGTVRVRAARDGARVVIAVENPCDADRPRGRGAGVGLANVRARLAALYGREAGLRAEERDGTWRAEIVLPVMPSIPAAADEARA